MTEEIKAKKFSDYKQKLVSYLGNEYTENLFNYLGGEEKVMNAPYAENINSGCAYDGSFIENVMKLTSYAIKINDLLPSNIQAERNSIVKVGLLGQISKVLMYEKNDNSWEVTNRGMIYKFTDLEGALRVGERSIYTLMSCKVKLSIEEFEAIRILDKDVENDNYSKLFSSTLSMVIKQAYEIINKINKNKLL